MQAVIHRSERRFTGDAEADPVAFCTWLLNTLHLDLTSGARKAASIITDCFQVLPLAVPLASPRPPPLANARFASASQLTFHFLSP